MGNPTLYERIGGDVAVQTAVNRFYDKLINDALLAPFFAGVDMDRLRHSQTAFVAYAFGAPHAYSGQSLRTAHKRLVDQGLSDIHFDAVAGHLKNALESLSVPDEWIAEALAVVETTRNDVLNR